MPREPVTVLTIGHSNRSLEAFLALLGAHDVARVVDVRAFPGSRKWPWFGRDAFAPALADAGIAYAHAPALGGRRRPAGSDANAAWENASFRAYADHMASAEFQRALDALVDAARRERVAVMCSEAVWWRCHRRLVSDALVARGHDVRHVLDEKPPRPHALTDFARVHADGHVTYPDPQSRLPL